MKQNKGPNPDGRKGCAAHQEVVEDIKNDVKERGLSFDAERKFDTFGGYKNSRYADVVVYESQGRNYGNTPIRKNYKKPWSTCFKREESYSRYLFIKGSYRCTNNLSSI